jgi:hypothetical protein
MRIEEKIYLVVFVAFAVNIVAVNIVAGVVAVVVALENERVFLAVNYL